MSTHWFTHFVAPAPHEREQPPCTQTSPSLHALPHAPQCSKSRFVLTHCPAQVVSPPGPHGPVDASSVGEPSVVLMVLSEHAAATENNAATKDTCCLRTSDLPPVFGTPRRRLRAKCQNHGVSRTFDGRSQKRLAENSR